VIITLTPYITAGLGAFDVRTTVDTAQSSSDGTTTTSGKIQSKVPFGIDAGGGIALAFGRECVRGGTSAERVHEWGRADQEREARHGVPVSFELAVGLF